MDIDLAQLRQDLQNANSGAQKMYYLEKAVGVLLDEVFKSKEEVKALKKKNKTIP